MIWLYLYQIQNYVFGAKGKFIISIGVTADINNVNMQKHQSLKINQPGNESKWVLFGIVIFYITKHSRIEFNRTFVKGALGQTCKIKYERLFGHSLQISKKGRKPFVIQDVELIPGNISDAMSLQDQDTVLFASPKLLPEHDDISNFKKRSSVPVGFNSRRPKLGVYFYVHQDYLQYNNIKQNGSILNKPRVDDRFLKLLQIVLPQKCVNEGREAVQKFKKLTVRLKSYFNDDLDERSAQKQLSSLAKGDNNDDPKQSIVDMDLEDDAGIFFSFENSKIQAASTPKRFKGKLKHYQLLGLKWMLYRQGQAEIPEMKIKDTPYWWDVGRDLGLPFELMVNEKQRWISWKKAVYKQCSGGILADEMGLGKTVMIISLILAHPGRPNLVIVPKTLMNQWESQIEKFAPHLGVFKCDQSWIPGDIETYGVVLITEGKLRRLYRNRHSEQDPEFKIFFQAMWFRVIIDEAHSFKNYSTVMAQAACSLNACYRWCLTGTPTQNSLVDFYSLIKFLRVEPWSKLQMWQQVFGKNCNQSTKKHYILAKQVLKGIMLRRKNSSKQPTGEAAIIDLPKINIKVHYVQMDKQTREVYREVDFYAKKVFRRVEQIEERLEDDGPTYHPPQQIQLKSKILRAKKRTQINQIFGLMMKMRMIASHVFLKDYKTNFVVLNEFREKYMTFLSKLRIKRKPKINSPSETSSMASTRQLWKVYGEWNQVVSDLSRGVKYLCHECSQLPEDGVITPCLHIYCRSCIMLRIQREYLQSLKIHTLMKQNSKNYNLSQPKQEKTKCPCPQCGDSVYEKYLFKVPVLNCFDRDLNKFKPNEKIMELLKYLNKMENGEKALIFTSFLGMMKLVGISLTQAGISYRTIKGSDDMDSRDDAVDQFKSDPSLQTLIITLKTGAVGLNLEVASWVFFMDPWWNPAIEDQAIGRVHRQGQQNEVKAVRFVTKNSIEAKIIKLGLKKKEMIDSVLDIDDIINNSKYSKNRASIRYLLGVGDTEDISSEQELQIDEQEEQDEQRGQQMNHESWSDSKYQSDNGLLSQMGQLSQMDDLPEPSIEQYAQNRTKRNQDQALNEQFSKKKQKEDKNTFKADEEF